MNEYGPVIDKIESHARHFRETGDVEYEVAEEWHSEAEVQGTAKRLLSSPYVYASALPRLRDIAAGRKPRYHDHWPSTWIVSLERAVKTEEETLEKERSGYVISGLAFADQKIADLAIRFVNYVSVGKRTSDWPSESVLWEVRQKYLKDGNVDFSPALERLRTERISRRLDFVEYEKAARIVADYLSRVDPAKHTNLTLTEAKPR